MLGPAQAARALAFPDVTECLEFADNLFDSIKPYNDIHVNNWKNLPIVM